MRRSKKRGKAKQNKKLIWLAIAVLVVGIGFAALQKYLNINGNASIDSRFDVRINKIEVSEKNGSAYEKEDATYTDTTARFNVGLLNPGDSITYDVKVINYGDLNAKLQELTVDQTGSSNIKYEITGISEGDIISSDWNYNNKTVKVKISYSGTSSEEYSKELSVKMLFVQTSERTTEQEEEMAEFTNGKSNQLDDVYVRSIDTTRNIVNLGVDFGDGPGNYNFDVIDAALDNVLVSDANAKNIPLKMYETYSLKTVDSRTFSGEKVYSQASDIKRFYFIPEKNNSGEFLINVADNANEVYAVLPTYTSPYIQLLSGYNYTRSFLYNSNVTTVNIPSDYDLTKLPEFSLYRYDSNGKNAITKIYNRSGETIDWGPIVGAHDEYGNRLQCSFAGGTCGTVKIIVNGD